MFKYPVRFSSSLKGGGISCIQEDFNLSAKAPDLKSARVIMRELLYSKLKSRGAALPPPRSNEGEFFLYVKTFRDKISRKSRGEEAFCA